jgi:hypothetical protein
MLLLDLDAGKTRDARVVAAACRVRNEKSDAQSLRFEADGIGDTNAVVRIATSAAPAEVRVGGQALESSKYDYSGGLLRIRFPNSPESVAVEVKPAR